jgi:integrase
MEQLISNTSHREPWNKGKLVGQKAPLKLKDIWAIRVRLQLSDCTRDLALFNLAIDSKLRACDLLKLRVRDVSHGDRIAARTIVMQQKTQRPVQFEITEQTRDALAAWIKGARLRLEDFLFPSRVHQSPTCPRVNMHALSIDGFMTSDWTRAPMVRTPCGGRRHP